MKTNIHPKVKFLLIGLFIVLGLCAGPTVAEDAPSFVLAWSEYPSWSAIGVASNADVGYVNGERGKLGPIEKKWNVDIVLQLADYDTCFTLYGASQA